MVASIREGLSRQLPTVGAAVLGLIVALGVALMPGGWVEGVASGSGLAVLIPALAPPLGVGGQIALALGGGAVAGAIGWAVLYLLWGPGGLLASRAVGDTPVVRRADAHPDAPPRRPLSAAHELAAPPPPVEQPLPADLDVPLAAFDPAAILPVPREPVRPVAPLAPGERLDTFALKPPVKVVPTPAEPSIDALLRRLEAGAERRALAR